MSAAIEKLSSGGEARMATAAAPATSTWRDWRIVLVYSEILVWMKRCLELIVTANPKAAHERRAAEKERQKEIRRKLRRLPPTTESSDASERPPH